MAAQLQVKAAYLEICARHVLPQELDAVVHEPYAPYVPQYRREWNGTLVLAEAQNLSSCGDGYAERLKQMTPTQRFSRLYLEASLRIQPWDDGSIKLAVESAFDCKADEAAVSNAVLWSQVDAQGRNINPSKELQGLSAAFWVDLLPAMKPKRVISCGKVAQEIIEKTTAKTQGKWEHVHLRLPSPSAMSRVSGMFSETDLMTRYPEVATVVWDHPEWVDGGYRLNKIFFACHAVSMTR